MNIYSPKSDSCLEKYYSLRWQILREPWGQERGAERDEFECDAYHLLGVDDQQNAIAVGRVHSIDARRAQIRYMAVANACRGRGLGSLILKHLEQHARELGIDQIVLNARETVVEFYEKHGYKVVGTGPLLYGKIAHSTMLKKFDNQT